MSADALYVDASAVMKLFVDEDQSAVARAHFEAPGRRMSSRLLSIEVRSGLARRLSGNDREVALDQWETMWDKYLVVELDERLAEHAALLAEAHGLGTLDAIHLASCLRVPAVPMVFATWDRVLWDAAQGVGLRTFPPNRP